MYVCCSEKDGLAVLMFSVFLLTTWTFVADVTQSKVRCIKPNNDKLPGMYTPENVQRQLLYAGVVETTRIRRDGYAIRVEFEEFIQTYKAIGLKPFEVPDFDNEDDAPTSGALRAASKKICSKLGLRGAQFGITKVFLKYYHGEALMQKMEQAGRCVTLIAARCRGLLARKLLIRMRQAKEKREAEEKARLEQQRKLAEMKRQQEEAAARAAALASKLEAEKFATMKREQATLKKRKAAERHAAQDALREAQELAEAARLEQEKLEAAENERQQADLQAQEAADQLAEAERLERREKENSAGREKAQAARANSRSSEQDMATPTKIDYGGVTAADMGAS